MEFYRNEVKVSGKKRILITCNHHENNKSKVQKSVGNFHRIDVIDRSGSMSGSIAELIEDEIASLSLMSKDDIITIIWFSGENNQGFIVKGAKNDDSLKAILRNYKSVVGTTCFSRPMEMVQSVIEELYPMCPNFMVNFFTDGNPVVSAWSTNEELSRTSELVKKISQRAAAVNTIGYGYYYSKEFLKGLAGMSQYGQFVHANDIREYQKIFDMNYKIIKDNILESVKIKCTGKVVYLNRKTTKMAVNDMELGSMDNNKNQFFLLLENDQVFELNGEKVDTEDITKESSSETIMNFFYALAYNYYYSDQRTEALDIIVKILGNQYLADRLLNAWTVSETQDFEKVLIDRLFHPENRKTDAVCSPNYIPKDNAFCFMDMIKLLSEDGASFLPFNPEATQYSRIGKETMYSEFDFQAIDKEKCAGKFDDLVFSKSRCNIGIKVCMPGYVNLKPEDQTPTMRKIECFLFRTYNLIQDGYPNMNTIVVESSVDVFNTINKKGAKVRKLKGGDKNFIKYEIDLNSIPVMNRKLAKGITGMDILTTVQELLEREAKIKVLEFILSEIGEQSAISHVKYSEEEQKLLSKYGIGSSGGYEGIGRFQKSNADCDFYMSKNVEFAFKGIADLPSINEYLKWMEKNKGKQPTGGNLIIQNAFKSFESLKRKSEFVRAKLFETKQESLDLRADLATAKIAVILTGSWISDFHKNDKGEFAFENGGNTILMKIKETKQYY